MVSSHRARRHCHVDLVQIDVGVRDRLHLVAGVLTSAFRSLVPARSMSVLVFRTDGAGKSVPANLRCSLRMLIASLSIRRSNGITMNSSAVAPTMAASGMSSESVVESMRLINSWKPGSGPAGKKTMSNREA